MADYKLTTGGVVRAVDGAFIPEDEANRDWAAYQTWAKKNKPDAADDTSVAAVPEFVTMMQARLAMLNASILDDVEAAIAAMTGDDGKAAQIQWQYASEVWRDRPLLASLQKAVGLTDKQVDDLFIAAAAIQ